MIGRLDKGDVVLIVVNAVLGVLVHPFFLGIVGLILFHKGLRPYIPYL